MKQDNFFDLKRFTHVLRNDFLEHKNRMGQAFFLTYLLFTCNIILLSTHFYESSNVFNSETADRLSRDVWHISLVYFAIYMLMFSAIDILALSTKQKRITYFMLPSTIFEKYLAVILRTVGFYALSYIAIFYLADWSRMLFYLIFYPESPVIELTNTCFQENTYQINFLLPYFAIISLQSIFILGAVSFYTTSFFKTLGVLLVAIGLYILLNIFFLFIFSTGESSFDVEGVFPVLSDRILAAWGVVILFALANWILAYYRLKESQIISKL